MNNNTSSRPERPTSAISTSFGLAGVVLFFLLTGIATYWNTHILNADAAEVRKTHEVILALNDLLSIVKDAETGQRGFVITGDERYLEPYNNALSHVDERAADLERLVDHEEPEQKGRVPLIKKYIRAKLDELAQTIDLRRNHGYDAARAVVVTDRGKNDMDALRTQMNAMRQTEEMLRTQRMDEMESSYRVAVVSGILTGLLGMLLTASVAYLIQRAATARRRQQWLQTGEAGVSTAMLGDLRLEQLGDNVLKFLAAYLGATSGAFFARQGNSFNRTATYGVPKADGVPEKFDLSDGLLGQAVKDRRTFFLNNVPDGYLTFGSALGKSKPRYLVIAPALSDAVSNGVLELGFIEPVETTVVELLDKVSEAIGIAVRSANYRSNLQNLLEETQRQAEELQSQGEELRVSNEELEEQSRSLKESQRNLEQQQAELEETNAQLEEQTQLLEDQRDILSRTKEAVQQKAKELERASRYKSDFLANMSHELRTPLNSSLILAKLLADNSSGNLTEEQVKFAQTIQSSGYDLLSLINDILDLSKIEAGHMEMRPERFSLQSLMKEMKRVFEPLTNEKGLSFETHIAEGCPDAIETDRQRLVQILKNLLSNAIKFTEKGKVELTVQPAADKRIAFAVVDSGIGIAEDHQQVVFEAFRQADGTISRKYGGTGLGLSISRELARLLGGTIELNSEIGKGSTFTATILETYAASEIVPPKQGLAPALPEISAAAPRSASPKKRAAPARPKYFARIDDDRDRLESNHRLILVIEDDTSFARILYDLAHEQDFQCIIATTAEEALSVAQQYMPNAVLLDVGLPDHSGLTVLDRLKHDSRTRHIPVHVVSAGDYTQTAMSLGAIGYMLKPVKHQELSDAFKQLETRLSQSMRRVLIVEDDAVQRDSISKLLASENIETVGVGTAAECLEQLNNSTFDCMVLDLTLPDASGYSLLKTLSEEDAYSFPPVIVYTGRDLSADQEQQLRRYSKSIIIKGAKSPERLLDEVTLFLHQVVSDLPPERQRMLAKARDRDAMLEGRRILVVEDDVRNVYALTNILEPRGAAVQIARNGREALQALEKSGPGATAVDLVLMDVMMPEMDGLTATREIRKNPVWKKLPVIMLTAKAMKDDHERCLEAGANDYMAKPLDVDKLLSLVRVWMPR